MKMRKNIEIIIFVMCIFIMCMGLYIVICENQEEKTSQKERILYLEHKIQACDLTISDLLNTIQILNLEISMSRENYGMEID